MSSSAITLLRDHVPLRPLLRSEALRIAELQAQRFLAMHDITTPPVDLRIIKEVPRVQVSVMRPFPASGASHYKQGVWMIILNGREPLTRQRFSLAHEFKHILDDRFVDLLYSYVPESERQQFVEQVCDFFAGCLLMPRPWLKRLYGEGVQSTKLLARRFEVSEAAIETRLNQIGLVDPRPRCDRSILDQSLRPAVPPQRRRYQRALHPAFIGAAS